MFLRTVTLEKPVRGLRGQNAVCGNSESSGDGYVEEERGPTKQYNLSNSVYFTILISQHTAWHAGRAPAPAVAWENASLS